ncbi:hypothetical protein C8Q74DRAFT_1197769 [Fomes fomentarius]|nr:hypothetical protein C8Q74DRAFT_1197769 [Fomes fomentarius]
MADQPGLVSQVDPELLLSVRYYRYTQLVSFVTFEREFELIWKKRWSVIKLAFIWHRYLGVLCVLLSLHGLCSCFLRFQVCRVWFFWETWGYCAALFTSEAVLLLWIYVLYNKNKWILTVISVCYVAEVISVISILTISFMNFQAQAGGIPGIRYCVMTDIGRPFQLLWVPILAYDALLLLLFLYRGCASACRRGQWRWTSDYDGLFDMIYRHSLLNFLAIFASYLACAIIWLSSDIGLYQIPVSFALAFSITNCTRLLLNIRRAYYSGVSDPGLTNIRGMSPTGNNSPDPYVTHELLPSPGPPSLDINVPMTPLSASSKFSLFSSSTLREKTSSPASTLRTTQVGTSPPSSVRVATGHHDDLERGEGGDKDGVLVQIVWLSRVDPDWWQAELRQMRVDPRVANGSGIRKGVRNGSVGL